MNVEMPAYKSYNCAEYFTVRKTEIAVCFFFFVFALATFSILLKDLLQIPKKM